MNLSDLEGYVAECERKIEALESQVKRLETRLNATIAVATREATDAVIARLRAGLGDEAAGRS